MRKIFGLLLFVSTSHVHALLVASNGLENHWYGPINLSIHHTPIQAWDMPLENGLSGTLANRGFYTFEIGKQIRHYVDVSLMYLNHETFNYQMYHERISNTGKITANQKTPIINLNNHAVLVNGFLHPDHDWYKISTLSLSPFIGGGVGYALNQIDNFFPNGPKSDKIGVGSNPQILINNFAWQASAGLSIRPLDHFSLDVGYRYYDGGGFDTNNVAFNQNHSIKNVTITNPWTGHVLNNQLFLDFKYKM